MKRRVVQSWQGLSRDSWTIEQSAGRQGQLMLMPCWVE